MSANRKDYKNIILYGILCSLALIFSYIESLIPFFFAVPGMKLGLANIVFLFLLFKGDTKGAVLVNICRVVIAGFLFGSGFSIIYSLSGAVLSMTAMIIIKKTELFSNIGVSIIGGTFHNIGQLIAASIVVSNVNIFFYGPYLIISGVVTGLLLGVIICEILKRINHLSL